MEWSLEVMRLYRRDVQQDVRELGTMLGEVIIEQQSEDVFETVENLRTTAIEHRVNQGDDHRSLKDILDECGTEQRLVVARAFATYFELINLAEERERIRALREQAQASAPDEGLEEAVDLLADTDEETAQQVLDDVLIEPTFTAHPTEARRKTVKAKLRDVASLLEALDERLLTDQEAQKLRRNLRAEVASLWLTPQVRERPPEPIDEAQSVHWYLENVLFDVVGDLYDELEGTIEGELDSATAPKLFEFRSWAGSDRDGNPFVTPEVTTETLEKQRHLTLEHYQGELDTLMNALSQGGERVEMSEALADSLAGDHDRLPWTAEAAATRHEHEPYRQKLDVMDQRLDRVDDPLPGGYESSAEFRSDLTTLATDLRKNNAEEIAAAHIDPLVRKIDTFGFTLASLDLRDHQSNHTQCLTELLASFDVDYGAMSETERVEFLTDAILDEETFLDLTDTEGLSEVATRVSRRFTVLADWHRTYGADAIDTYCISMCDEPSHVLEVLLLATEAGVVDLPEYASLDIVPLLETEYALSGARRIMGTLFENEAYGALLDARDGIQEIMLGYSDSNKENGYLAAQWSLYENQRRLSDICADFDVEMRLFHGRGGSISRGGGSMHEALLALPNETVTGQVKFTEQGETIAERYANPKTGKRELEQMLNAQLRARLDAIESPTEQVPSEWLDAMGAMATAAREEYRDLLETDGFVSYFEQATPITVIENLNLGSRPASRSDERSVEDLRAIPWVFSWMQSRCTVPGWYSLATVLDAYLDGGGDLGVLREMYSEWPFFRKTVDNAALALARTDMNVAVEYAALADDDLRERFFPRLWGEYDRGAELVRDITGRDSLLGGGWLEESLRRRNPYVDPLHLLQVRLLDKDERSDREERTLRLTVKGIAAGVKNTG